jgi:geranylgeranyl reductase family protein
MSYKIAQLEVGMMNYDTVIIGAGPAGAVAAITLAQAGYKTVLVEKHSINKDKTCGDGLIEDSQLLLSKLGLKDELMKNARLIHSAKLYSPSKITLTLESDVFTYPRKIFDQYLRDKAKEVGSTILYDIEAIGCIHHSNHVEVLLNSNKTQEKVVINAKMIIIAGGANTGALKNFGVLHQKLPTGVAGRAYFQKEAMSQHEPLHFIWDKSLVSGYGWIFPIKGNIYNVGLGIFSGQNKAGYNIKMKFHQFITQNPIVKEILKNSKQISEFKGAPLRCGLSAAQPSLNRILIAGESLGTTYHLTGEGIGKAMATGELAAKVSIEALTKNNFSSEFLKRYDEELENNYGKRFKAYARAQRLFDKSFIIDLIFKMANKRQKVKDTMINIFREQEMPEDLFSIMGLIKALI